MTTKIYSKCLQLIFIFGYFFVLIGGDKDCSSKCVLGISISPDNIQLLILVKYLSYYNLLCFWMSYWNILKALFLFFRKKISKLFSSSCFSCWKYLEWYRSKFQNLDIMCQNILIDSSKSFLIMSSFL